MHNKSVCLALTTRRHVDVAIFAFTTVCVRASDDAVCFTRTVIAVRILAWVNWSEMVIALKNLRITYCARKHVLDAMAVHRGIRPCIRM